MASSATSFQKKSRTKLYQIPGTRHSLHNNQLLISSGIPSLDNLIGGGVAVGTVVLIEEDKYGSYSKMILKYFLAEGVMNKHELFLTSADLNPQDILDELPGPVLDEPVDKGAETADSMKIAWRYEKLAQVQSTASGIKFGHYYDLTKNMDSSLLENTNKTLLRPNEDHNCTSGKLMNPACTRVLGEIQHAIRKGNFETAASQQQRNILRIGIHSLGSPLWGNGTPSQSKSSLCRFFYALRALMRTAYAICMITVPMHIYQDSLSKCLCHLSDLAVRLDSFSGATLETNPAFQEYHGLFHLLKLPRLNSLSCHMPDTMDLAFKLRKKKFMIEKFHLPPELSDTTARSQEDAIKSCNNSSGNKKLDF